MRARSGLRALVALQWILTGLAKRAAGEEIRPRVWSNRVLRAYLGAFSGDVINVSGWKDEDKEGGRYRDYYGHVERYVVSNVEGDRGMPAEPPAGAESLFLDLEAALDPALERQFDVVFAHTVLEHVFDLLGALETLSRLTRDVVVIVVPFSQRVHYTHSYGDYVRVSPLLLKRFFEERGFTVLLSASNDQPFQPVYVVFVAARDGARHAEAFRDAPRDHDIEIHPSRWGRYGVSGLDAAAD